METPGSLVQVDQMSVISNNRDSCNYIQDMESSSYTDDFSLAGTKVLYNIPVHFSDFLQSIYRFLQRYEHYSPKFYNPAYERFWKIQV